MSQRKIAFTGVHGSGKTTKVGELQDRMKGIGKTVIVVDEVARSCPYTLGTIDAQEYIWHNQMMREKQAMRQDADVVICDRTVMDNLVYYYAILWNEGICAGGQKWARWGRLYQEAKEWMPTYDQIIRLPLNLEWLQADDPIRSKDVGYAQRIDRLFDRFVDPFVTNKEI